MVVISGKNLGERQKDLNLKVAEMVANKGDFNDIKNEEETNDVDKLYKIDIASQYKNIDYIIDVLKSGDSLYISRALKCVWLYHDSYKHIINTENVHTNIFPFMSIKMKKKMLSTISTHLRNNELAADYFNYCKENEMPIIALKFLNLASEEFKLSVLRNERSLDQYLYVRKQENTKNFVGSSFVLAANCIEIYEGCRNDVIHNLRYLYAMNNDQYLDILEKYELVNLNQPNVLKRLGIRISRDIMLKHKKRVLENPLLYVNKLNKSMLVKYSSQCDVKKYLNSLIPEHVKQFWGIDFCTAYDYILNVIPINEKYEFMKQLFSKNYPGADFEMTIEFYNLRYFSMLSIDQQELWALRHIDERREILGNGNDYIWYKFVSIDKALLELKKYILVTPDNDNRSRIVNTLVEAARNHKDLKKVLDYYYDRHVNEEKVHKINFLDKVLSEHNVFEFNMECWEALDKIFYSLDMYSEGRYTFKDFITISVVCHILHKVNLPQVLMNFIDLDVNYSYFSILLEKLGQEKSDIVFQYILKIFVDKLKPFEQVPLNNKLRKSLMKYVNNIFNLISCFRKEDDSCPEFVKKFMDTHSPKPEEEELKNSVTAKDIYSFLKTDATLAVDVLHDYDPGINDCTRIVNNTLRKLKVYFHNDVAQAYINFLERIIDKRSDDYDNRTLINSAVFGLFQLGDEKFKITLMEKYLPKDPKIEHSVIDRKLLYIQEAICRFMGYSRPPVPLKNVLQYMRGDYVQYCLPIFNMYMENVPLPLVIKFTDGILNTPLSVQKHGLRLAFECYTGESLKTFVLSSWKKSKNVSLRMSIYKSLLVKVKRQPILYEALKHITSDLHQDDHEDLFKLIYCCRHHLPEKFLDDYLQTAWHMTTKLPMKPVNIGRQTKIINSIEENIKFVQKDFIGKNIIIEHVREVLQQKALRPDKLYELQELSSAKWKLTASYIVQYNGNEELEQSLEIATLIFKNCVKMWDDRYKETYVFQKFCNDFIDDLENKSLSMWLNNPKESFDGYIFKHIFDMLQEALPLKEIYFTLWNLKLIMDLRASVNVTNTVLCDSGAKDNRLSFEEILSDNIANHLQIFVQGLLDKHQFYIVFLPDIASLLRSKLDDLENTKNLDIFFCQSLANVGLKETHLLTLMILPTSVPKDMREIHDKIIKKIQAYENDEIQSFLHFNFS